MENVFSVTVRFDRSSNGTNEPSSFVKLYSKSFMSNDNYDDCWRKIEVYKKKNLSDGVISINHIHSSVNTYSDC